MKRGLALAGSAAVVVLNAHRRRVAAINATDPCGPAGSRLPEGRSLLVAADDGGQLAVTVAGPDDGPTVVLAHCWTGSQAVWATVARRLVLAGNRVVLYDQRGHGRSTSSEAAPSIDALGRDLRAVLDAADSTDAVLVGHSMGGMSIQSYSAVHPEHFVEHTRAVVLVATAARVLGRGLPGRVIEALLGEGRQEWTRRGRVGRSLVRGSLGRQARRAHVDLTLETFAATTGAARAGFLTAMATMDLRDGLRRIAVPVTVLVGTRDLLTPPRLARHMAESLPDAQLLVVPGAGHMLPLEAPDRIVDAVGAIQARSARTQEPSLLPAAEA